MLGLCFCSGVQSAYLYAVCHLQLYPHRTISEAMLLWIENSDTKARAELFPSLRFDVVCQVKGYREGGLRFIHNYQARSKEATCLDNLGKETPMAFGIEVVSGDVEVV